MPSSDIYQISDYIESLKQKFIDLPEDTLSMGIFGYLNEVHSSILQNTVIMSSEYSNEAIPVKAKFEKNIIGHALSLGINKINATPAYMTIALAFPESALVANMKDNKFILDKNIPILIEGFEYHLDYDVLLTRNRLPDGTFTYTALYDMDSKNPLSNITNPYLPPVGIINITDIQLIMMTAIVRQVKIQKVYKKLLSDNPLENKIIVFEFDSQLAYFDLMITENGVSTKLTPIYEGLYDFNISSFCNYLYLDSKTIRIKFDATSYMPTLNADVVINLYTTEGANGNFVYKSDIIQDLISERFSYDKLFMIIKPINDSSYGVDRKSIDDLKQIIPKEALSRGSITTTTDLHNFFNSINDSKSMIYFSKKIDNQFERAYFAYLILKNGNIVVPTNTIDLTIFRTEFDFIGNINYVLSAGNNLFYRTNDVTAKVTERGLSDDDLNVLDTDGFLYINPFMIVVNKTPFFVSYFLTIFNSSRLINFNYINKNSQIQFITSQINWRREFFTDRHTYKLNVTLLQNINNDFGLVTLTEDNFIADTKIKVIGVIYNEVDVPLGYCHGNITEYLAGSKSFSFEIPITTDDTIDGENKINITNTYAPKSTEISNIKYSANVAFKIFVLVNDGNSFANRQEVDNIVPGLDGYTLTNTYDVVDGVYFYQDYTELINSPIIVSRNPDTSLVYKIAKVPMIRSKYIFNEDRIQSFVAELEKRRVYLDYCLENLQDSFRIDFKLFNTYGPSKVYYITDSTRINKLNLTLDFRVKFISISDRYCLEFIINDIKSYIEDIGIITDLHMPNIITFITTKYQERVVYFEFVGINGYGPGYQHIYNLNEKIIDLGITPEFLNINTREDGEPDINITIM